MSYWSTALAAAVFLSVGAMAPPATATALPSTSSSGSSVERSEPHPGPDDPPVHRAPPERPSTVLETRSATTSLDRSLAAGRQAAPSANRTAGSLVAAGGADVVNDTVLATVASVTDRTASRAGGADRYDTAVALSAEHFPMGAAEVWLATGEGFPDGLTASAVAGAHLGPVLLTQPGRLPPSVGAELSRLAPSRVWIVGGTSAVSEGVVEAARAAVPGIEVNRLAGDDRYGTAAALASEFFPSAESVFIATGLDFPDALGAAPAAAGEDAPTLLVTPTSVPSATESELVRMHPARVYVVGGSSVVPEGIAHRIGAITGAQVIRVSGSDRYATAAAVSDRFFKPTTAGVVLATGLRFPDAVAAGAIAGSLESPLLLVDGSTAPPRVTLDAARRVSWWLPDTGSVLRYVVVTHPDDEFAAWSLVGQRDPRRYDVVIILTTGESTAYCDGSPVDNQWSSQQYLPQPQPTGLPYSDRCKQHRMDSWNVFFEGSENARNPSERLTGGPIAFGDRVLPVPLARNEAGDIVAADAYDLFVGPDHSVAAFDMGGLTTDEVLWAIQTVRGLVDRFPTDVEGDVVGAGFFNDTNIGYHNVHGDHAAVYRLLGGVDLGLPGSQYTTVGHLQAGRAFGAMVPAYCHAMCHPGAPAAFLGSMGRFQFAYGWLADGYWPPGEVDAYAGFSRYQSFAKWF